jgi:hypothetical protein
MGFQAHAMISQSLSIIRCENKHPMFVVFFPMFVVFFPMFVVFFTLFTNFHDIESRKWLTKTDREHSG